MDPQSTLLHHSSDVLRTPTLIDVSEYASPGASDESRGEPIRVNAMAPSWSPITAKRVADGGVMCDFSLPTCSSGSSFSSPLLDDESGNHTSISPVSQATASFQARHHRPGSDHSSPLISPHPLPPAADNSRAVVPLPLPDGQFSCPHCPRKFSSFGKARYELKNSTYQTC